MARKDDDTGADDDVRAAGHSQSGGHVIATRTVAGKSRIFHAFDDPDDGDEMPYEFREYPKHVTVGGKVHVCNTADEEATARAGETIVRDDEERRRLVALAGVKGVQVDGRWGLPKISAAIADAGHDPAADPFA